MDKFYYDVIERVKYPSGIRYACVGENSFDLLILLGYIGEEGWELVGEIEGQLIVKKKG